MKRGLLMMLMLAAAVFLGRVVGDLTNGIDGVSWLGKVIDLGISTTELNLGICNLTFGFQVHICLAEIIFMLIAVLLFSKVAKLILG